MKYIVFIVVALFILAGGYWFLFQTPTGPEVDVVPDSEPAEKAVTGVVQEVDTEQMMVDGPGMLTLSTERGEAVVLVPSLEARLCEADIASVFLVRTGDVVEVFGLVDSEGRIMPCGSSEHYLRVERPVVNETIGYQFSYPIGPDGYIEVETGEVTHEDFLFGHTLFNRAEYEEFQAATEPREGPPAMHVRVYDNPNNLSATLWAEDYPQESNIELALTTPAEAVVGGANAVSYLTDGLFPINTYVVAHGGYMFVLLGAYPDETAAIYQDFSALVESLTFIPTDEDFVPAD